ncbi:MAG: hypothetical protein LJE66_14740 [Desulfobacterales bacterium]|jgi:hypothetical protein|nr:hypothetical protein [Desulfobacterales bacterium]
MFKLVKIGNQNTNPFDGSKSEEKTIIDEYYRVQFFLNGKVPSYLFKLRNNSSNKPYILVKQDSYVFRELNVGDILDMEYNPADSFGNGQLFKTLITSKIPHDRYTGYSMVELSIINN